MCLWQDAQKRNVNSQFTGGTMRSRGLEESAPLLEDSRTIHQQYYGLCIKQLRQANVADGKNSEVWFTTIFEFCPQSRHQV